MQEFFAFSITPRVLYKAGLVAEIGHEIQRMGKQRALIITDAGVVGAGLLIALQQGLAGALPGGVLLKSLCWCWCLQTSADFWGSVVSAHLRVPAHLASSSPPAVIPPPEPLCPATAAPWRSAGGAGT